jgi:lipopolysaccharide transport system ATP-binding protein
VTQYLAAGGEDNIPLIERHRFQNHPRPNAFSRLAIRSEARGNNIVPVGGAVTFEIDVQGVSDLSKAVVAMVITDDRGQRIAMFATHYHGGPPVGGAESLTLTCRVPSLPLTPGAYFIDLILSDERHTLERIERAGRLEVVFADVLGTGRLPNYKQGHVVLPCEWAMK